MHNLKINSPPNSPTGIKRHLKTSADQSLSKKAYQNDPILNLYVFLINKIKIYTRATHASHKQNANKVNTNVITQIKMQVSIKRRCTHKSTRHVHIKYKI